jgi:thioredoxin-like negative regulator of GroEL
LAVLTHWLPNETADRAHGRNMEILLEDASRLLQRGQKDEAARRLSRLIKQDREILQRGFRARALLSQSTGQQGLDRWDPRQTLGMLETKKREHRLTLKELRYLAQLNLQAGALEAGSAALSEYLDSRPQDPLMRFELGRLQHAQGKNDSARANLQLAMEDGLLFTTRGMHGCELLARLANDAGDVETARRWIEQASQLSILLPWYSSDTSSRELSQRLKESADYKPPGVLNDLVPY